MNKIPVSSILSDFQLMLREKWSYIPGGSEKGKVDCSGAFVYSYRQHGHSIYHGSNRIARTEVSKLYPIGSVQIVPGMAAFKSRIPGDSGYALPSGYQPGGSHYNGDMNDYYHVGLVDDDTSRVLNAQSSATGFVASDISKGWTHVAYLSQVEYDKVKETPNSSASIPDTPNFSTTKAEVVAKSGSTVKMRKTPSKDERVWESVPVGSIVEIRGPESKGWYPIRYSGKDGYMMAEYLKTSESSSSIEVPNNGSSKKWSVTIVDLSFDEANVLLEEYPGRSFPEESNG